MSEDEVSVFAKYGYYSKPFAFNTKSKIIAVNMQSCNNLNWYLLEDRDDPGAQLQWLEGELSDLEKAGGFAHIMAHIPTDSCLHQFGIRFKSLMERYQHIIRFSSFGHTHQEDIQIVQAINTTDNIGFNLITGSGTTMTNINPGFTVIDFDEEYMVPVNTHTYYMDMDASNQDPTKGIKWVELHDMVKEYNLKDMSPNSMAKMSMDLFTDVAMANKYEQNRFKLGNPNAKAKANDMKYKCMIATETFQLRECMGQKDIDLNDGASIFDLIISNWITTS